jgi:hypothetical protein
VNNRSGAGLFSSNIVINEGSSDLILLIIHVEIRANEKIVFPESVTTSKCQLSNANQQAIEEQFRSSLCIVHANASTAV